MKIEIDKERDKREIWILRKMARMTLAQNIKWEADGISPENEKDFKITIAHAWNNAHIEKRDAEGEILEAMRSFYKKGIKFDLVLQAAEAIF